MSKYIEELRKMRAMAEQVIECQGTEIEPQIQEIIVEAKRTSGIILNHNKHYLTYLAQEATGENPKTIFEYSKYSTYTICNHFDIAHPVTLEQKERMEDLHVVGFTPSYEGEKEVQVKYDKMGYKWVLFSMSEFMRLAKEDGLTLSEINYDEKINEERRFRRDLEAPIVILGQATPKTKIKA